MGAINSAFSADSGNLILSLRKNSSACSISLSGILLSLYENVSATWEMWAFSLYNNHPKVKEADGFQNPIKLTSLFSVNRHESNGTTFREIYEPSACLHSGCQPVCESFALFDKASSAALINHIKKLTLSRIASRPNEFKTTSRKSPTSGAQRWTICWPWGKQTFWRLKWGAW